MCCYEVSYRLRNTSLASHITRSLFNRACLGYDGKVTASTREAIRGLLVTDHVILNHGQVTWSTPELAPPLLTTTPHQRKDVSALDRFNVHRCPTRLPTKRTKSIRIAYLMVVRTFTPGAMPENIKYKKATCALFGYSTHRDSFHHSDASHKIEKSPMITFEEGEEEIRADFLRIFCWVREQEFSLG
ncbi:uncharacterized protein TNCV_2249101 [Trichonephila clavipes]|nr:uncharacterized protein TNCV_2249101 [Trichonephila clavipes]